MKNFKTQVNKLISGKTLKADCYEAVNIIADFPNSINTLQIQYSNDGYYYMKADNSFHENEKLRVVYILDTPTGITKFKVVADSVEQRNGWVLAIWRDNVVGGVKTEFLKAFYLESE